MTKAIMKIKSTKQDEIGEVINSIRGINAALQKQSKELMRSFRITGPQLGALRVLHLYPEISLRELSERMYLHVSTVCGIVDRLEMAGYLTRSRNTEDKRAVIICLTEKGLKTIKEVPISGFGAMFFSLQKLPAAQVRQISKAMKQLSKMMKIEDNDIRQIL
jgi:MarR family transcriptional regulator, organic hydroperoxide resistance regulator